MPGTPHSDTEGDPNKQMRKERFLREIADGSPVEYHPELKKEPLFDWEVKAGTIIPAVMIGGANSDLPGQVIAQVRENVFDTRSGRAILIPQGARLIGMYDSQVAYGQERLLLAWNRIIYPDGSSLNLKGMPGVDLSGYAGFSDKVNNHYGKMFGSVILMSLIGTGVELAQPKTDDKKSFSQALGESLAQQLGQASIQMTQKNLNIQPSLEIRPGYAFNIMVTADLVLPPFVEE